MRLTRRERWRAFFTGRLDGCVPRSRLDLELKIMNGWGLEMDAAKARVDQLEPALVDMTLSLERVVEIVREQYDCCSEAEAERLLPIIEEAERSIKAYPDGK